MPSVSNIAVGAAMAGAAASRARQQMNESIARLSTGVRAMYGADAAGHSMGKNIQAVGQSYVQAARNVEDGISYAQMGESVLLEVANLAIRLRELGIASRTHAVGVGFARESHGRVLIDANQDAAIQAEAELIYDTVDQILDTTDFNTVEVVDGNNKKQVNIAYGPLTANVIAVGPNQLVSILNGHFDVYNIGLADRLLAEVAEGLGNIAADLTALRAFQGATSATGANMAAAGARLIDTDFALETASLAKNTILNQAALAMAAQANAAQSSILSVLL